MTLRRFALLLSWLAIKSALPSCAADDPVLPTLWLVGDSTVRNGRSDGTGGLWGWGDLLLPHFDTSKLRVVNRALGGRGGFDGRDL